jgi:hypothetical protein
VGQLVGEESRREKKGKNKVKEKIKAGMELNI